MIQKKGTEYSWFSHIFPGNKIYINNAEQKPRHKKNKKLFFRTKYLHGAFCSLLECFAAGSGLLASDPPDISLYAGVFLLYVIFHCIGHKRRNSLRIFYLPCKNLLFKLIYRISFQIDKLIFIQMLL